MDNNYHNKIENGFYETFKKELPEFKSTDAVAGVVGECLRAAKRAEMKISKQIAKEINDLIMGTLEKHTPKCKEHMRLITDAIKQKYDIEEEL